MTEWTNCVDKDSQWEVWVALDFSFFAPNHTLKTTA
jgi:hypothetical protein